jgi:hypothetical protein
VAYCDIVPIHELVDGTHKRIGLEKAITESQAKAFCVISSGTRIREIEATLARLDDPRQVYVLTNTYRGWKNELSIRENRILRTAQERAEHVGQSIGLESQHIEDLTDTGPNDTEFIDQFAEYIQEGRYTRIFEPVGGGTLNLMTTKAADKAGIGTKVVGFTPAGANGILLDPKKVYEEREGKLYWIGGEQHSFADKLVCPYTALRDELLATFAHGHSIVGVSEWDLKAAYSIAKTQWWGVTEPSSAAGLCGVLPQYAEAYENERVLILLTGTMNKQGKESVSHRAGMFTRNNIDIFFERNFFGNQHGLDFTWNEKRLVVHESSFTQPATWEVDIDTLMAYSPYASTNLLTGAIHDLQTGELAGNVLDHL